jgi:hypothetical protein
MEIIYINLIRNYLYGTFVLLLIAINPLIIKSPPPPISIQFFIESRNERFTKFNPRFKKYNPTMRLTKNKMLLNLAIDKNKNQTF